MTTISMTTASLLAAVFPASHAVSAPRAVVIARASWVPPPRYAAGRLIENFVCNGDEHTMMERATHARNAGINGYVRNAQEVEDRAKSAGNNGVGVDIHTFGAAGIAQGKDSNPVLSATLDKPNVELGAPTVWLDPPPPAGFIWADNGIYSTVTDDRTNANERVQSWYDSGVRLEQTSGFDAEEELIEKIKSMLPLALKKMFP
jgi:hypothetical protein